MERYIGLMQFEKDGPFNVIASGGSPLITTSVKRIKEAVQALVLKNKLIPSQCNVLIFRSLEPEDYPEL